MNCCIPHIILSAKRYRSMHLVALACAMLMLMAACEREPFIADAADTIPPIPPAGFLVERAQDGFITISWLRNSESDLFGYIVYRSVSAEGPFATLDTIAQAYYIDEQRAYDSIYYYYVTAIDASGNISDPTDTVYSNSPNLRNPRTPGALDISPIQYNNTQRIRLSWIPEDDSDIYGFHIYRGSSSAFTTDSASMVGFTTLTVFDDSTALELNTPYYYRIIAVDNGGWISEPTEPVWEILLTQPALISPESWQTVSQIPVFSWKPVPMASAYELQILETPDDVIAYIIQVDTGEGTVSVSYSGPALQTGKVYYWRVVTFSREGGYPNSSSEFRAFIIS